MVTKRVLSVAATALMLATGGNGCGDFNAPGNKTPAESVATAPLRIDVEITSHPADKHALVTMHALDHSGLVSVDVITGELYPHQHIRRLPYGHWFMHPPTATVTYRAEALMTGEPGDILACAFYVRGVKVQEIGTPHVSQIEEGQNSAHVLCEYYHLPGK